MEAATQADPLAEVKERQKDAKTELASAKAELKKHKSAVTKAKNREEGLEGDELTKAQDATKEAQAKVADSEQRVANAERDVASAKDAMDAAREAEKERKAEERKNRPKKSSLTLSQRRALLKMAQEPQVPRTDFNALPYKYLVEEGLAQAEQVQVDGPTIKETEGEGDDAKVVEKPGPKVEKTQYSLTDAGKERASDVNAKWLDWKPPSQAREQEPVSS